MSERGFWDDNLLELQQKYWERWSGINRRASGTEAPAQNSPWEMALEHWWQAVSPAAPEITRDFMTRMIDQGKQFFRIAELFSGNAQKQGKPADWTALCGQLVADMQSAGGSGLDTEAGDGRHNWMGFWELPFDNWQRMASTLSLLPGDPLRNMPHGGSPSDMERLFSAPGLGYSREEQAQQQKLLELFAEYRRALQEYSRFFTDIGSESVKRLRDRLGQRTHNGEVIDSARTLYDTWVETCEEVYGERVRTSEYARINGRLVNAAMGVKNHFGIMIDESLGALNMPTRREVRTLQVRVQENRREIRCLQAELEFLKGRFDDLPAARTRRGTAAAATTRKTAPRKRSSVKKPGNFSNESD